MQDSRNCSRDCGSDSWDCACGRDCGQGGERGLDEGRRALFGGLLSTLPSAGLVGLAFGFSTHFSATTVSSGAFSVSDGCSKSASSSSDETPTLSARPSGAVSFAVLSIRAPCSADLRVVGQICVSPACTFAKTRRRKFATRSTVFDHCDVVAYRTLPPTWFAIGCWPKRRSAQRLAALLAGWLSG